MQLLSAGLACASAPAAERVPGQVRLTPALPKAAERPSRSARDRIRKRVGPVSIGVI